MDRSAPGRAPSHGAAAGKRTWRHTLFVGLLLAALAPSPTAIGQQESVHLFAAASTAAPLHKILAAFPARQSIRIVPVFAASGTLARQIASGAPADLYLSANPDWMAWLDERNLVSKRHRAPLIGNCLVLVQPVGETRSVRLTRTLAAQLEDRRLGMADPALAPLGAYARAALQSLGLWDSVKDRLAIQPNARALLALAERGEVGAAILYRSDAWLSQTVRMTDQVPPTQTPEIRYPFAILQGRDRPAVRRVFNHLRSAQAVKIFLSHGFIAPGERCPS